MKIIPSIPAAIVTGAIIIPLCGLGWRFIERTYDNQPLVILWVFLSFIVPVFLSTMDLQFLVRRWRENGVLRMCPGAPGDFRLFYVPAWRRMLVLFGAAVVSGFLLRLVGVVL